MKYPKTDLDFARHIIEFDPRNTSTYAHGDGFAVLGSAYKGEESVSHEIKKRIDKTY
jgi:hypothetical protein